VLLALPGGCGHHEQGPGHRRTVRRRQAPVSHSPIPDDEDRGDDPEPRDPASGGATDTRSTSSRRRTQDQLPMLRPPRQSADPRRFIETTVSYGNQPLLTGAVDLVSGVDGSRWSPQDPIPRSPTGNGRDRQRTPGSRPRCPRSSAALSGTIGHCPEARSWNLQVAGSSPAGAQLHWSAAWPPRRTRSALGRNASRRRLRGRYWGPA
jgi:hypothetical protein